MFQTTSQIVYPHRSSHQFCYQQLMAEITVDWYIFLTTAGRLANSSRISNWHPVGNILISQSSDCCYLPTLTEMISTGAACFFFHGTTTPRDDGVFFVTAKPACVPRQFGHVLELSCHVSTWFWLGNVRKNTT